MTMSKLSTTEEALLDTVKVPLVETDLVAPGSDVPARLRVQHLVAHGHERLGYLTTSASTRRASPGTSGTSPATGSGRRPEPDPYVVPARIVERASVTEQV